MRYENVWDYISKHGLMNGTDEEIIQAKKDYAKLYSKQYQIKYAEDNKQLGVRLTCKEMELLELNVMNSGLTKSEFVRKKLFAPEFQSEVSLTVSLLISEIHDHFANHLDGRTCDNQLLHQVAGNLVTLSQTLSSFDDN